MSDFIREEPLSDDEAMRMALELARRGFGRVAPNPPVGCVILDRNGYLIGSGFHQRYGGPHAEIEALQSVQDTSRLDQARVFVTLEPCAHFGRTPPCSDSLAQLPIKKLIYGVNDPNPLVSGRGLEKIRAAGILVEKWTGNYRQELEELVEIFLINIREQRAFFALKAAVTLDGLLADHSGRQQWISNVQSREETHLLRAHYQAILVGKRTVELDDPRLDVRSVQFPDHRNQVVVVDSQKGLGPSLSPYRLSQFHLPEDIIRVVSSERQEASPHEKNSQEQILFLDKKGSSLDLRELGQKLFQMGICSVLVEGGGITFSHFLTQKAADRLILFYGTKILGNPSGISWTQALRGFTLKTCPEIESPHLKTLGNNIMVSGRLKYQT